MMWFFILAAVAAGSLGLLVFLVTRVMRFAFIRRISGERKSVRVLIAFGILAVFTIVCGILLNAMNTAVIVLHLGMIWFLCDRLASLLQRFRKHETSCYYAGGCAIVITALYLVWGWHLANNIWITEYAIRTDKETEPLRIVQFADSHVGVTFDGEGFAKQMERINELSPDVLLITGDYVDDDTSREDMVRSCEALGTVRTTYGVYYSFGNHDKGYYGAQHRGYSGADLIAELEKNGVRVLQDEAVPIGSGYVLIGRQDRAEEQMGAGRASMEELTKDIDPELFSIVMDHQPHDYAAQERVGVDLVLSGHTHGGQLFPINFIGEWSGANEKSYGLEKRGNTTFIVTSGIADWALNFKTGCRSEIVVVEVS